MHRSVRSSVLALGSFALLLTPLGCQMMPGAESYTPPPRAETPFVGNPTRDAVTSASPRTGASISPSDVEGARDPARMLSADQLPAQTRAILRLADGPFGPAAVGTGGHPFTTARASGVGTSSPVEEAPWRATGKLIVKFGDGTFVCTASVIRKNLLVTAAHCIHRFGQGQAGFAQAVTYEPARHEASRPFGTWQGSQWWIPTSYADGSDVCAANAVGVVCENDVAVVSLQPLNGQAIADVTGSYDFPTNENFGVVDFLGEKASQITQLGYPLANFDGDKMIRTDSLGYRDDPMNIVIGSNQTGGSSGGPWLQNFGTPTTEFTGPAAMFADPNMVVGTTSWGFTDGNVKIQGASRFSRNTAFTTKSNIQTLVDTACQAQPAAC